MRSSRRPGEQVHAKTRRRLQFGTPEGALQAAEALLRHPPITPAQGSNAQRWFDDLARLVDTAQRQLVDNLPLSGIPNPSLIYGRATACKAELSR
uniref:Uncharacterized protein n=1 Tax=Leersia perrieri TaxID=77586 RepID=A0A0D9VFT9_9ORYZ